MRNHHRPTAGWVGTVAGPGRRQSWVPAHRNWVLAHRNRSALRIPVAERPGPAESRHSRALALAEPALDRPASVGPAQARRAAAAAVECSVAVAPRRGAEARSMSQSRRSPYVRQDQPTSRTSFRAELSQPRVAPTGSAPVWREVCRCNADPRQRVSPMGPVCAGTCPVHS